MEQRLRLIQGTGSRHEQRATDRRRLAASGQILWKDSKGSTRIVPVVTRDVSETGVAIECQGAAAIPLYRLVHLQLDRAERGRPELPVALRRSTVLSAVFRIGPCNDVTGTPTEYALRLIVESRGQASAQHATWTPSATVTRTA